MPWICPYCGSTNVLRDASVDPNNNNAVIVVYDNAYCTDCEGETCLEWYDDELSDTMDGEAHRKDAAGGLSGGADCSAATPEKGKK